MRLSIMCLSGHTLPHNGCLDLVMLCTVTCIATLQEPVQRNRSEPMVTALIHLPHFANYPDVGLDHSVSPYECLYLLCLVVSKKKKGNPCATNAPNMFCAQGGTQNLSLMWPENVSDPWTFGIPLVVTSMLSVSSASHSDPLPLLSPSGHHRPPTEEHWP